MRSAGNFHPDWGYLAPAPSFMRTARIVLVATAIGATAGAAVMISLVQHPATDPANAPIAAHALVTSLPVVAEAPVSTESVDEPAVTETTTAGQPGSNAVIGSKPSALLPALAAGNVALAGPSGPANVTSAEAEARLAETPNETVAEPMAPAKETKKSRTAGYDQTHRTQPAGKRWKRRPFDPLFHLFSSSGSARNSF
jgi:hypothetical protein